MQKVTYINIRGESIVFTGEAPYIFHSLQGAGAVETSFLTSRGVYQHGDTTQGLRKEPRYLELRFHIEGASREDMYQRRVQATGILSTARAYDSTGRRGKLVYENDYGRWWIWAIPERGPLFEQRIRDYTPGVLVEFKCEDPYWRTVDQSSVIMAYAGGAFQFPMSFPITFGSRKFRVTAVNTGQVDAPVHIEIYGSGEMPRLVNHSTGMALQLSRLLSEDEVLTMDTDTNNLQVYVTNLDTGATESAFGYLTLDSALSAFVLRPGDNLLEYMPSTGGARSRVLVSWYGRMEGV